MWLSNKSIPEKILMYWQALDSVRCEKVHCTPNCSQHVEGEINKVCESLQCHKKNSKCMQRFQNSRNSYKSIFHMARGPS